MLELTTGNESQLNKLIQSGDVSRALQLASAAILAVDKDKKARTQERLKEKRKEVINKFSAFNTLLSALVMIRCPGAEFSIARRNYFVLCLNNLPL